METRLRGAYREMFFHRLLLEATEYDQGILNMMSGIAKDQLKGYSTRHFESYFASLTDNQTIDREMFKEAESDIKKLEDMMRDSGIHMSCLKWDSDEYPVVLRDRLSQSPPALYCFSSNSKNYFARPISAIYSGENKKLEFDHYVEYITKYLKLDGHTLATVIADGLEPDVENHISRSGADHLGILAGPLGHGASNEELLFETMRFGALITPIPFGYVSVSEHADIEYFYEACSILANLVSGSNKIDGSLLLSNLNLETSDIIDDLFDYAQPIYHFGDGKKKLDDQGIVYERYSELYKICKQQWGDL